MPSDASFAYKDVNVQDSGRLHAGNSYKNVVYSKDTLFFRSSHTADETP